MLTKVQGTLSFSFTLKLSRKVDWRILCSQSCGIKEFYLSRSLNTTSHNNPLYSFECGLILRLSCGLLGLGWACGFNKGESQRELAASSRNGFP